MPAPIKQASALSLQCVLRRSGLTRCRPRYQANAMTLHDGCRYGVEGLTCSCPIFEEGLQARIVVCSCIVKKLTAVSLP